MTHQGWTSRTPLAGLALTAGLLVAAGSAQAAPVLYDNVVDFTAAAGPLTIEDFNAPFTTDATNPDPLDFDDFRVTETVGIPNLHQFSVPFLHVQADNPSTVVFEFTQPINAFGVVTIDFAREVGIAAGEIETITYLDNAPGATPIEVVSVESSTDSADIGRQIFFGIVDDTNTFDTVALTFSTGDTTIGPHNGDDVGLENLAYAAVPLPPAIIALGSALLLLAARYRRRG